MSTSVSSVTNHFPDAENGFSTTTSGAVSSGATTVGLNSTSGYTNGMPVVMVIDPADTTKKQTFTGIIDTGGNQVTGVIWTAGTNTAHDAGATVVDYATATHVAMVTKGILVEHNQDGTHDEAIITSRTEDTTPASGDYLLTSDVSATNALKKVTLANLGTNGAWVGTNGITNSAVTPAKRSGGFYVGTMVVSATGNQSVTGVGFTPKLVEFHGVLDAGNQSPSNFNFGQGFMDASGNQWEHHGNVTEGGDASGAGNWTTSCFATGDAGGDVDVALSYVSMDADGFTVNVSTAENATRVGFVAYG